MMTILHPTRRGLITGLIALAAAPAIVRATSLMPVKVMKPSLPGFYAQDFTFTMREPTTERFRYAALHREGKGIVGVWDYGHAIKMFPGETFTLELDHAIQADGLELRMLSKPPAKVA